MITELEFIRDRSSFWREVAPLSEDFIKRINLAVLDKKIHDEILSNTDPNRRSIINEVAFDIFAYCYGKEISIAAIDQKSLESIAKEAALYVNGLKLSASSGRTLSLTTEEITETLQIANLLLSFFKKKANVIIHPVLPGYSGLNQCYGDVLADDTLYEIKAGNRKFRSVDIRQLVLYASLNYASQKYAVSSLGLYNPRCGYQFQMETNAFCINFSGMPAHELFHKVTYSLGTLFNGY